MSKEIINLGDIPLVNNLFLTKEEALSAKKYELKIVEKDNLLMKLSMEISPDELFSNYLYRSSVNKPYIDHCCKMWDYVKSFSPKRIADIGGNDGALLKAFKSKCHEKLELFNIDASTSFIDDNKLAGINYINDYWGSIKFEEKFDLITSTNVFQHNVNYDKFLKGVSDNLDGIWILEFPYFLETVKTNQFDQIYHEHIYYWLLTPLYNLFKKYNLKIIDLSMQEMHGGSLRIVSSNKKDHNENTDMINIFLKKEKEFDFGRWGEIIAKKIQKDRDFIKSLSGEIAVFGAAAKGCVYLNCLNISSKLTYIIDDTKQKQNLYSPGTGLKILDRTVILNNPPDYLIILAHNFKDYIIDSLRKDGYKNKIITMIPEIKIYE